MQKKKIKSFFAVCPKRLFLILGACVFFSVQTVLAGQTLVPMGKTVGVTMDTKGLLVLGTGSVDGEDHCSYTPSKGILQAGDLILEADGKTLENKETFMKVVEESKGEILTMRIERNGREKEVSVRPVFSTADSSYKIGAWIRDSIQGIGTVTYYDPATGSFGALGHGVYDVDTDELMEIREGALVPVELTEIVKGEKGKAGELTGKILLREKFAVIDKNTEAGIFGRGKETFFTGEAMPVAATSEIEKGRAYLLSDFEGGDVKAYEIEIESIQKKGGKQHKDMTIRITDERMLKLTGGIVQGVSGSPICQNGKIVGAVTHVLVNDPTRGYGIFIENMLEAEE